MKRKGEYITALDLKKKKTIKRAKSDYSYTVKLLKSERIYHFNDLENAQVFAIENADSIPVIRENVPAYQYRKTELKTVKKNPAKKTAKPKRAYYGKYVLYENGKFMGQSDKLKELRVYYDGFVANKPNSVFTIKNMDTGEIIKTSEKARRKPVKRVTKLRKNPVRPLKMWNVYARMNTYTGQGWQKIASFPHNEIGKNDAKDYAYAYYEKHDGEITVKVDDK